MRFILSSFCCFIHLFAVGQHVNYNYAKVHIDTLYLFEPFGSCLTMENGDPIHDTALTLNFKNEYKKCIKLSLKGKIININDNSTSESTQEAITQSIKKLSIVDDSTFKKINCGKNIGNLMSQFPGRYYGIVCFSGVHNDSYTEQLILSSLVSSVAFSASGYHFFMGPFTTDPRFRSHILIIDKITQRFVYLNTVKTNHSPSKEKYLEKHIEKLLRPWYTFQSGL